MALINVYVKEFENKEEAMAFKHEHSATIHLYGSSDYIYISESEYFDSEQLPLLSIEDSLLYVDDTNPRACKIFRFIQVPELDETEVPKGHDFSVKGLVTNLFPLRTLVKGELQNVKWYADKEKTDLVIEEAMNYNRDVLGFALDRVTTRTWYREDGSAHHDTKVTVKEYDDLGQIEEGVRRRGNLVKSMQKPILGLLGQTMPNMGPAEIGIIATKFYEDFGFQFNGSMEHVILIGREFMKKHQNAFNAFVGESNKKILFDLQEDDAVWLDNVINGSGTTIRDFLISELTL